MTSAATASNMSTMLIRRLYRSLLKTARPFTGTHPRHQASQLRSPVVLNCLLHRTGAEDEAWMDYLSVPSGIIPRIVLTEEESLFCTLLRDVMNGSTSNDTPAEHSRTHSTTESSSSDAAPLDNDDDDVHPALSRQKRMQFPVHVDTGRLRHVIRREFRRPLDDGSPVDDLATRQNVAFRAIQELNKKLTYAAELEAQLLRRLQVSHPGVDVAALLQQQAARHVAPLPLHPPKSYLRPGLFLLAHPQMRDDFFHRLVICILDHRNEDEDDDDDNKEDDDRPTYRTYGLVVNRVSVSPKTGKTLTLVDVLRPLPVDIVKTFGRHPVREGGPFRMAPQMIYQVSTQQPQDRPTITGEDDSEQELYNENPLDGTILPPIQLSDDAISVAADSDKAVYFRGSISKAARAVDAGRMDREDIAFFVGTTKWPVRELEVEIEHGYWLPCRGPTTLAQSGICEHVTPADGATSVRPEADLWLSMLSACGTEEAKLALLLHWDDGKNPNGFVCDA